MTFKNEIKFQIDVALREAAAAVRGRGWMGGWLAPFSANG